MQKHRFEVLDGLRGVAAVSVVLYHAMYNNLPLKHLMPRGYLAVDFFFVLSGFVIAYSFEHQLASRQVSALSFWRKRISRFAVLSFIGSTIGLTVNLLLSKYVAPNDSIINHPPFLYVVGIAASVLLFPYDLGGRPPLMPLNPPAWSLVFEMFANISFAALAPVLSLRRLTVIVAASALCLCAYSVDKHFVHTGMETSAYLMLGGALRSSFGFSAGILVCRLWRAGRRAPRVSGWWLAAALVAVLQAPGFHNPLFLTATDLFAQIVIFPLLVWFGASAVSGRAIWRWSGEISFPLYAIHFIPLQVACNWFAALGYGTVANAAFLAAFTSALCVASFWLFRLDNLLRRALFGKSTPMVVRGVGGAGA